MKIIDLMYRDLVDNGIFPSNYEIHATFETIIHTLSAPNLTEQDLDFLETVIKMCNVVYNTMPDKEILHDEIYDRLVVLFGRYRSVPVGFEIPKKVLAPMIEYVDQPKNTIIPMISYDPNYKDLINKSMYGNTIVNHYKYIDYRDLYNRSSSNDNGGYISKGLQVTKHEHPELIGTLDKCKFVIDEDAKRLGVYDDPNVTILERDWFDNILDEGIINVDDKYQMVLELKYDGVSVEADCCNGYVISARSRGDTGAGLAVDYTPILEGYRFPHHSFGDEVVGVKFEAIMTKPDLIRYNQIRGKDYKNCRSAIVSLIGSSDARHFRDFITLVPLQVEDKIYNMLENRINEIGFLNQNFVSKGVPLHSVIIYGDYNQLLFQIREYVKDAEAARDYVSYMYDGVVVSFTDNTIRKKLGRVNHINKYSMAIKFRPMKKITRFLGYNYTVGQNGVITPMINYEPVEFFGTIHTLSSGHSLKRFKELDLHYGDMIAVEYVNDVMPYVSSINQTQPRGRKATFITHCPCCGSILVMSDSNKSILCTNLNCKARLQARMTNMFNKLNMFEFGMATIERIGKYSLSDLCEASINGFEGCGFGDVEKKKLTDQIDKFRETPIFDYELFGALGFSNVAKKTWQLVFSTITFDHMIKSYLEDKDGFGDKYYNILVSIKGVGPTVASTIINEMEYFINDITYCHWLGIINPSFRLEGMPKKKSVRFTGFRNKDLISELNYLGFDADDGAVTKSTDILLIPFEGFVSSKTSKVSESCIIITADELMANIDKYL